MTNCNDCVHEATKNEDDSEAQAVALLCQKMQLAICSAAGRFHFKEMKRGMAYPVGYGALQVFFSLLLKDMERPGGWLP
jgi:hypothetical protein